MHKCRRDPRQRRANRARPASSIRPASRSASPGPRPPIAATIRTAARAASGGSRCACRVRRARSATSSTSITASAEANFARRIDAWKQLDSINAINTTVEACNPSAHSCTLTQSLADRHLFRKQRHRSGRQDHRLHRTAGTFAIRRPSSTSDNIVYNYGAGGTITSVVRDGQTWGYNFSLAAMSRRWWSPIRPARRERSSRTSPSGCRPRSPTSSAAITTYAYDTAGRLTQITAPEGNYVAFAYDGRGNVIERHSVAKSGSGLADIVSRRTIPTSCANPVTCNQPDRHRRARQHHRIHL